MNTDQGGNPIQELNAISGAIIGAAQSNTLGCGFLEKVYEDALALELRMNGHEVFQQKAIDVRYREEIVGEYLAELLVDKRVVVELQAVSALDVFHRAQCLNYLRATRMRLASLS